MSIQTMRQRSNLIRIDFSPAIIAFGTSITFSEPVRDMYENPAPLQMYRVGKDGLLDRKKK